MINKKCNLILIQFIKSLVNFTLLLMSGFLVLVSRIEIFIKTIQTHS